MSIHSLRSDTWLETSMELLSLTRLGTQVHTEEQKERNFHWWVRKLWSNQWVLNQGSTQQPAVGGEHSLLLTPHWPLTMEELLVKYLPHRYIFNKLYFMFVNALLNISSKWCVVSPQTPAAGRTYLSADGECAFATEKQKKAAVLRTIFWCYTAHQQAKYHRLSSSS